jgi:hypothetical protein
LTDFAFAGSNDAAKCIAAMHRDYRPIAELALKQGWGIRFQANDHIQFRPPNPDKPMVSAAKTPGDTFRGCKQFRSQMMASGLLIDIKAELEAEHRERRSRLEANRAGHETKLEELDAQLQEESLDNARIRTQRLIEEAKEAVRNRTGKPPTVILRILYLLRDHDIRGSNANMVYGSVAAHIYAAPNDMSTDAWDSLAHRAEATVSNAVKQGFIQRVTDKDGKLTSLQLTETGRAFADAWELEHGQPSPPNFSPVPSEGVSDILSEIERQISRLMDVLEVDKLREENVKLTAEIAELRRRHAQDR